MAELIRRRIISIACSQGSKELRRVRKFSVDEDVTIEVAKSTAGAAGFHVDDDKGGTITLEVFVEAGTPEIDWYDLKSSREIFAMGTQDVPSGARLRQLDVIVEKITAPTENNGQHVYEVSCKFLRQVKAA